MGVTRVVPGALRLEVREGRVEGALEDELRDLVVVAHVVVRSVRDDDVRPGLPHELDHEALLRRIGCVHLAVGEPERRVLGADDGGRASCLVDPDP